MIENVLLRALRAFVVNMAWIKPCKTSRDNLKRVRRRGRVYLLAQRIAQALFVAGIVLLGLSAADFVLRFPGWLRVIVFRRPALFCGLVARAVGCGRRRGSPRR